MLDYSVVASMVVSANAKRDLECYYCMLNQVKYHHSVSSLVPRLISSFRATGISLGTRLLCKLKELN